MSDPIRYRYVRFRDEVDLPGKNGTIQCHEWNEKFATMGGYLLTHCDLPVPSVRIEVPPQLRRSGVGDWLNRSNNDQPMYGLGAIVYVPMTNVRKYELRDDAVAKPVPATDNTISDGKSPPMKK